MMIWIKRRMLKGRKKYTMIFKNCNTWVFTIGMKEDSCIFLNIPACMVVLVNAVTAIKPPKNITMERIIHT